MRFSSFGLWKFLISGWLSAFTVSMVKLRTISPVELSVHSSQSPAIPIGAPSARAMAVATLFPDLQSGSTTESAGITHLWPLAHGVLKDAAVATVSERALKVENLILRSFDQDGSSPNSAAASLLPPPSDSTTGAGYPFHTRGAVERSEPGSTPNSVSLPCESVGK